MHANICLNPYIFHNEIFNDDLCKSLKDLLSLAQFSGNIFLIVDENKKIEIQYKLYQNQNTNQNTQKKIEIILSNINSVFSNKKLKIGKDIENFYLKDGKFSFSNFYNKVFKEIKCVKNSKSKSFYVITTLMSKFDKSINLFHKHYLEKDINDTDLFNTLKEYRNGIEISQKSINKINEDYFLPIVWNAKEIYFIAGDINGKYEINYSNFLKWIKKLLSTISQFSEHNQIKITLISGQFGEHDGAKKIKTKIIDELKKEDDMNKYDFEVIFHLKKEKIKHIHPRALMANDVVISYETVPIAKEGEKNPIFKDKFNDITLKQTYLDKFIFLTKN